MQNRLVHNTIAVGPGDWNIRRFSLLIVFFLELHDENDERAFCVAARNSDAHGGADSVLSQLHHSDFQQLWLFAGVAGDGLAAADCAAIRELRRDGGVLLVTRGHMDLGSAICSLASGRCGASFARARATFHHFVDYNWNSVSGVPSFLSKLPGRGIEEFPAALASSKRYMRNVAFWLAGRS